jgi:hypothetical protein
MNHEAVPKSVSPDPLKDRLAFEPKGLPASLATPVVFELFTNSPVTSHVPPTDNSPANAEVATSEPAKADAPIFVYLLISTLFKYI